jgi:chemotaxis response regulator CheB
LKGKLFLVHWDSKETRGIAKDLKRDGWIVNTECKNGGRAFERIKRNPPDVVVINLSQSPSHGREIGFTLKNINMTKKIPVVFADADEKVKEITVERVPNALFSTTEELNDIVEKYKNKKKKKKKGRL